MGNIEQREEGGRERERERERQTDRQAETKTEREVYREARWTWQFQKRKFKPLRYVGSLLCITR